MKRSNRLILLVGILLAVVAFVGIYLLLQQGGGGGGEQATRNEAPVAVAKVDIPLGTKVTESMVETQNLPKDEVAANAIPAASQAIGKIARQDITNGQQITQADFATGTSGNLTPPDPGKRAISVLVEQVSGVGTLVAPGDYVDMIVSLRSGDFRNPAGAPQVAPLPDIAASGTSTKVLIQGMRVLGVLLPPPPETTGGASPSPGEQQGTTVQPGQQEIVIVEVDAQQAEVIRFAQVMRQGDSSAISLALRSPTDFADPSDPTKRIVPLPDATSGTILRNLLDTYQVLTPVVVDGLLPAVVPPLAQPTTRP